MCCGIRRMLLYKQIKFEAVCYIDDKVTIAVDNNNLENLSSENHRRQLIVVPELYKHSLLETDRLAVFPNGTFKIEKYLIC
jgi:hypothetical protein